MNWVKNFYFRQVALILALAVLLIGSVPAESMAYVVGSEAVAASQTRGEDMDRVQTVLESKIVSQKLSGMGLSTEEVTSRLDVLNDSEIHQFAAQIDSLYPGGDGLGVVIALLIVVILVIVILKLSDKKLIIQ
ncbi:MAG TPA: PA2779 family protein [Thermodesulfobacteriota bacterium]|nr:PA2779 family protein [Thermodesulfobacteriota bacterium]